MSSTITSGGLLALLLFVAAFGVTACGEDLAPEAESQEAAPVAPESQAEREAAARFLWLRARSAPPAEKAELFRRVIARFPETEVIPDAFHDLSFWLADAGKVDEAVANLKTFASRCPQEVLVSAAHDLTFRALTGLRGTESSRGPVADEVLAHWGKWLEEVLPNRRRWPELDRGLLLISAAQREMAVGHRAPEGEGAAHFGLAARYLEEATQISMPERKDQEVLAAFTLGQVRHRLGEKERAQVHYLEARRLREEYGVGPALEDIDALISEVTER